MSTFVNGRIQIEIGHILYGKKLIRQVRLGRLFMQNETDSG